MSLNGDVTVIRNGRSTSTISIYNYPEHLNPFYEDDQHKRLRFWPINKKGDEGRRNSFSLGGFKDIWAFKSFRTKKKSSTLGINKTSESPPTLRRVYPIDTSNLFNSYDRRARYSSNDGDNFQRNASYRSSLQNVQSTKENASGFGLNRNDQYRSTIQFGNPTLSTKQTLPVPQTRRYVYGGSVTPQPSRNSEFRRGYSSESLTHGSSQTSISTNPFDSDNDNDEETEHTDCAGSVTSPGGKRTPRKKRRAPAPPILVHSTNGASPSNGVPSESSQANQSQTELRIQEDIDIANLTAEIETFVKNKSNETPENEIKVTVSKEPSAGNNLEKRNGTVPKIKPILKTSPNMVITKEFRSKPKDIELQINEDLKIDERPALPEKKRKHHPTTVQSDHQQVGNVECIHLHVDSPQSAPEEDLTDRLTSFKKEPSGIDKITAKTSFTLTSPPRNRREIPDDARVQQNVQVTPVNPVTTVNNERKVNHNIKVNGVVNGSLRKEAQQIEEKTSNALPNIKPPIAAKPICETNAKVNSFAALHKPVRRRIGSKGESEDFPVSNPNIKNTEEIIIDEIHKPKISIENTTTQTITSQNTIDQNEKHVIFAAEEANDKTTPVPESCISLERKPNISLKPATENLTDSIVSAHPLEIKKPHKIEPHVIPIHDCETGAQSSSHSPKTSRLAIVETQENSLRIEEPTPSTSTTNNTPSNSNVNQKPRTALLSESREEFEALYRNRPSSHTEWKRSTLAPLETHIPPEKRRSVKDIIESINRSQRLLHAAAQKDLPELITTRSMPPPAYSEVVNESSLRSPQSNVKDNDLSQTLRALDDTPRELENMLPNSSASTNDTPGPSHLNNCNPNTNNSDTQKPNNEEIFKKCRVKKEVYDYRETSPTASNLDWNPVPKPKRSKNLSEPSEI